MRSPVNADVEIGRHRICLSHIRDPLLVISYFRNCGPTAGISVVCYERHLEMRALSFPVCVAIGLCLTLVGGGCGGGKKVTAKVKGSVTVSGKPLSAGGFAVAFMPSDKTSPTVATINADGTFEGDAAVGKNTVYLIPAGTQGGHGDKAVAGVGDAFTSDSTSPLNLDVAAGKENTATFEVGGVSGGAAGPSRGH